MNGIESRTRVIFLPLIGSFTSVDLCIYRFWISKKRADPEWPAQTGLELWKNLLQTKLGNTDAVCHFHTGWTSNHKHFACNVKISRI